MSAQVQQPQSKTLATSTTLIREHWGSLGVVVVLGAVCVFHLGTLMANSIPHVDEAWNTSRAWGLVQTGRAFGTLDAGVFDRFDGYWTYFPWLGAAVHAPFVFAFGPGLFATRFASLFFGVVLLTVLYVIASRLYNRRTGVLAVLLAALSVHFVVSSHLGRHDIIVAAMGYGAVALYVTDKSAGRAFSVKSLLAGLLVGLTLDVHMNGVIFGPAIGALYLLDHGWGILRAGRFWSYAAGGLAGVAFYVLLHLVPYPGVYSALYSFGNGSVRQPPLLSLDPGVWVSSLLVTLEMVGAGWVLLSLAAIAVLVPRRSRSDKILAVLFAVLILAFAAAIAVKQPHYPIILLPASALLAAAALDRLLTEPLRGNLWRFAATAAVGGLALGLMVQGVFPAVRSSDSSFPPVLAGLQQAIPRGSSIIGSQSFWFGFANSRYLSWEQIMYHMQAEPGSTVKDALVTFHPDYFIMDPSIARYTITDARRHIPELDTPEILRASTQRFLDMYGTIVSTQRTESLGEVRVYRIDWDRVN
ncbi:MAG TPA: glycosyltransferase family 39 protein [Chloroflexia bacterium]|nr:glycosyltransferase family 39 protein [Chloroflexia bacterium]